MKVLQINTVYPNGSTGKIAKGIYDLCIERGMVCKIAYRYRENGKHYNDTIPISSWLDCHVHNRMAKWTGFQGCFSHIRTTSFLRWVDEYKPDIIHLHNIHGNYINIKQLFRYIKRNNIMVIWTLHDCWPFTGGCPHYTTSKCVKWQTHCNNCPSDKGIRKLLNASKRMYCFKKELFTSINQLHLVANSNWTAFQAQQSFLQNRRITCIYNGIDLTVFQPRQSTFRKDHGISAETVILLGVAFDWGYRKGLDVFIELSKRLDKSAYTIVLVGTNDTIDEMLPISIISIHRTANQKELAEIYTGADIFINPTREESLGLVNIEANACGTPVITYRTGGCPECISDISGSVVDYDDVDALEAEIIRVAKRRPFKQADCILQSQKFDMRDRFREYINLYETYNQ